MRNKYAATCYKCGKLVQPDDGYFERHKGGWRVQHVGCKGAEVSFEPMFENALAPGTESAQDNHKTHATN